MSKLYPVGTRVLLRKGKYDDCLSNPLGVEGSITKCLGVRGYIYRVEWDNSYYNNYKDEDLELAEKPYTENDIVPQEIKLCLR